MNARASLGQQIAERFVRVSIAIVGLLVLRGILSMLPMLREDPVWTPNFQPTNVQSILQQYPIPNLYAQAIQDILQSMVDPTGHPLRQDATPEQIERAKRATADFLLNAHLAIYPITIAKAVVDTLIFAALVLFGRSLAALYRAQYARFPDLGQMLNFVILTVAAGIAYYSYQGIAYPFLYPDNGSIYGWVFLVLALAPLLALAAVVARNMDALTALVMRSGTAAPAPASVSVRCASCGQMVELGSKFCPHCASPTTAPVAVAPAGRKWCSACGSENPATAKFCKGCGGALAA